MNDASVFDLANALVEFGRYDPVGHLFTLLRLAVVAGGCFSFAVLVLMTAVQMATLVCDTRASLSGSLVSRRRMPALLGPAPQRG